MHFKENEIIKDSLSKLNDHFAKIDRKNLTVEQILGFTREFEMVNVNYKYSHGIRDSFDEIALYFNHFNNIMIRDDLSIKIKIGKILEDFKKPYFYFDEKNSVIDKKYINGQLSIYKEWIDFSQNYDVKPSDSFEYVEKNMTDVAAYYKKTSNIIKNLASIIESIEKNKENHRYVNILINEFIQEYKEKIQSDDIFYMAFNENLKKYEHSLYQIEHNIQMMKNDIGSKSPDTMRTLADKFCGTQNIDNSGISNFLRSKEFDDFIDVRLQLKGQSRPDNILFIDGSYAYVDKGKYIHITSYDNYIKDQKILEESIINHLSRKKPKIANFFKKFLDLETVELIIPVLDTYQQYSDVINKSGLNVLQLKDKSLEAVDDIFNAIILEHKVEHYVGSILSKKYEHLLTTKSLSVFKSLYETGVSQQSLQTFIGKKLAALKNPDEFFEYVEKVKIHFSNFNEESLNAKLVGLNITPTYSKDGVVIFHVDNFDKSTKLGSVSWCIARTESYFSGYTNNNSRQYFIYDFNKKEEDNTSMLGVTLYENGTIRASHLKNDDDFIFLDKYSQLHLEIIKNDFEHFKLTDILSKTIKEKYNLFSEEKGIKNKKIGQSI